MTNEKYLFQKTPSQLLGHSCKVSFQSSIFQSLSGTPYLVARRYTHHVTPREHHTDKEKANSTTAILQAEKKSIFISKIYSNFVFQLVVIINPKCIFATKQNARDLKAIQNINVH